MLKLNSVSLRPSQGGILREKCAAPSVPLYRYFLGTERRDPRVSLRPWQTTPGLPAAAPTVQVATAATAAARVRGSQPRLREGRWKTRARRLRRDGCPPETDTGGNAVPRQSQAPQKPGSMYPAGRVGVQSCADCGAAFSAHALAAERSPLWTLAGPRPRLGRLLGTAAWSESSAFLSSGAGSTDPAAFLRARSAAAPLCPRPYRPHLRGYPRAGQGRSTMERSSVPSWPLLSGARRSSISPRMRPQPRRIAAPMNRKRL